MHGPIEKSGKLFLSAGKHPIHLSWFNLGEPGALTLFFEGPDLPRKKIPDKSLFLLEEQENGTLGWTQGVHYKCYEGSWIRVPNFGWMDPVREGRTTNFHSSIATRSAHTGLEFDGFIELSNEGLYTFSSVSDDGCLLYVGNQATRLEVIGTNVPPEPVVLSVLQPLTEQKRDTWAEVEGHVTFVSAQRGALNLELSAGTGRMRVEVVDGSESSPRLLRNSKVRARGISQTTYTADGQRVAGSLITPSIHQIEILELAPALWAECPTVPIGQLLRTNCVENSGAIAHVRGKIQANGSGGQMLLVDETGHLPIVLAQGTNPQNGEQVEALGRCNTSGTNLTLQRVSWRPVLIGRTDDHNGLPLLTKIEQVKGLSRQEAQRGYPVRVRGIITTPLSGGFFIQDVTWAIYVRTPTEIQADIPRAGDYWEVEGDTFAEFAPNILARRAARLGAGLLPEPLHPTWDQLINGSLDTRYVEIQGVVTAVDADGMALLTRAGILKVELSDVDSKSLRKYENSLIRVRGCVIPARDDTTQRVELGHIWLSNSCINIDEPAPSDPFAAPLKRVADLLFFDPRAGAIQRVKVAGQIMHERHGEYFLLEGTNGVRFIPRVQGNLKPGDLVEVVGFPDLAGPSPLLREAVARRAGTAPLPAPQLLTDPFLLSRGYDARLVQVKARLANFSLNRLDQILEVQSGTRGFVARLETGRGTVHDLIPGSWLELTGTYAGQGGDLTAGRDINSFELLLNSTAAIRVLERPPWWNLPHTLMVVGGLSILIMAALVWIALLRRQVEERSRQLTAAMQRQERIERQHALERERSRIAQDLHDDLGATLTQIRLLSALESRDMLVPIPNRSRMSQVTEKARKMVASLDEIVWAVNPANDSLISLATYCCHFAEEFLRPTGIRCRLDVSDNLPHLPLTSEVRHNLYLTIKEALNNVVKHSRATEVWLRVRWQEDALRIILEDNGRGFASTTETNEMNAGDGLINVRRRLEIIGGKFETESQPGSGTTSRIWLPLATNGNGHDEANEFKTYVQHKVSSGIGGHGSEHKSI
jgi:signal transduction histidine kinase